MSAATGKAPEVLLTRLLDAPRQLVFEMWKNPAHMARWWGPRGFTTAVCEIDFRAGGKFRFVMRGPNGKDYPFTGSFVEIVEPKRLVFVGLIHDMPGYEAHTTVTFEEENGKTRLTVHQTYSFVSEDIQRGAPVGWAQTLDKLVEYVAQL